jgi:predicted RNA binding protein YcfA (HicA-like mRNA interferase family)
MPRLPVLSGRDLVRALGRLGYEVSRTRVTHARLVCPGRPSLTVPLHDELDRGTLSAILRQARISAEELARLLP